VKKVANGQDNTVFSANRTSNYDCAIRFLSTNPDKLEVFQFEGTVTFIVATAAVFRDPSAWYHIAVAFDTTQATSTDRIKVYVNGVLQVLTGTFPSLNFDADVNAAAPHAIGRWQGGAARYLSGYLADIHFIDGQALDPTSFGEFDDTTGVWVPKAYTGTYGTNGFHLDFADNASTTTIGYDAAGSNDWTANNLSVTAGAGNDSLVDVPTNGAETDTGAGGEVRGNYCTWNPLSTTTNLANGNLEVSVPGTTSPTKQVHGTLAIPNTGKWYFEITSSGTAAHWIGIGGSDLNSSYLSANSYGYNEAGRLFINDVDQGVVFNTFGVGDTIGVAVDMDANTVRFYKNGVAQGSAATSIVAGKNYSPAMDIFIGGGILNAGQRPFAYTAPSGFKALNTANLPAPLVTKPSDVMDVALYTGNGSTQTVSTSFGPDLLWIKCRSNVESHAWTDVIRGDGKLLFSNDTAAEETTSRTALGTTSFTVVDDASSLVNELNQTYVAWAWDAGTTTTTNTQGSISSQVRANASAGFSIVTWTGNGTLNASIGHGLGVKPALAIIKNRSSSQNWPVFTDIIDGSKDFLYLNTTAAKDNASSNASTSTLFYLSGGGEDNGNTNSMVGYFFAPVAGYSSFGSYTGNGSADGPFVFTGMRPRYLLWKRSDATADWTVFDAARDTYNYAEKQLLPNSSAAEQVTGGGFVRIDFLSNGFKVRSTDSYVNASGGTYIYAAFAESPFGLNNRAR
jgi:hypothetical protein